MACLSYGSRFVLRGRMNFRPIDSLRGLSILFVLIYHWGQEYGAESYPIIHGNLPVWLDRVLFESGYFGVRIFFVISGFLITWTTIQRFGSLKNIRPADFYIIRLARIGPPLLALVGLLTWLGLISFPYMGTGMPNDSVGEAALHALTFRMNVLLTDAGSLSPQWAVLWSLAIEGAFYLLFPLLCLLLPRPALLAVLGVLCVIGPLHRRAHLIDATGYHVDFDYLSCLDGIALGVLCALLAKGLEHSAFLKRFALPIFLAGVVLTFIVIASMGAGRGDTVMYPTYIGLAAALALLPTPFIVNWTKMDAPLRWLGVLSYEFYMTHYVVLAFMRGIYEKHKPLLSHNIGLWALVYVAGAVFAAAVMYFVISNPCRKAIGRLARSKKTSRGMANFKDLTEGTAP